MVACGHEGGSRKAIAAPGSKTQELQVVSVPHSKLSDTGVDEISVYISGSCGKGKTTMSAVSGLSGLLERNEEGEHCPYITIAGGASRPEPEPDINLPGTAGNPLTFNAYSPTVEWVTGFESKYGWTSGFITKPTWAVFIKHLFFTDPEDKYCTYLIQGASCDGLGSNAIAEVHAYTREKWTMEASFSWGRAKKSDLNTKQNLESTSAKTVSTDELIKTQWSIEGKATGHVGADNFVLEATPDFLKNVFDTLSHLLYFLASADDADKEKEKKKNEVFTWEWMPPKIAIAAERELKENAANNLVDMEYKYAIKMDPFFGVKAKLDVLQMLINLAVNCAAPGAGIGAIRFVQFVQEVLLKAEDKAADTKTSVSFKAAIDLDMELVLAGELSCTKVFGGEPKTEFIKTKNSAKNTSTDENKETKGGAELAATGKMKLKGEVIAEFRHSNSFFEVHAAAGAGFSFGATGGGDTELTLKLILEAAKGEPDFKGELEFKGLVLSFMSLVTGSINKANTDRETSGVKVGVSGLDDIPEKEDLKKDVKASDYKELWTIFEPKKLPFWEN